MNEEYNETSKEKCLFCRFWKSNDNGSGGAGMCRESSPSTHVITYPVQTVGGASLQVQVINPFPTCEHDAWCGKFSPILDD